jgi:hypothetical protein
MKMLRSSRQTLENLHEQKEDWNSVLGVEKVCT